jgi:Putative multicopper oxidases
MAHQPTRRAVLGTGIALAGTGVLAACASDTPAISPAGAQVADRFVSPEDPAVAAAEAERRSASGSGSVRKVSLTATPGRLDLGGGVTVPSWAYEGKLPGNLVRVTAGDTLALTLANHLPRSTSMHWHGLAVRNDMDGVPGLTQRPIEPGADFAYRFTVPHPGTYWFHPHSGVQQDRGLYAPLIVDDPHEPLSYDKEWVVVLDDWLDGVDGSTPDSVLAELRKGKDGQAPPDGGMDHDGAMDHEDGGHSMGPVPATSAPAGPPRRTSGAISDLLGGHAGDVAYPYYLINGRVPQAPSYFDARPGDRIRLRIVNAGGDTAFRIALGGHQMTVTHTDGYPVRHTAADALLLGMGERYDVLVTAGDGVFPLTALAEGKKASALAVLRTAPGAAPAPSVRPKELDGKLITANKLAPDESVALREREPDRTIQVELTGSMAAYDWAFDGQPYDPLVRRPVEEGERVRLVFHNSTSMWHPIHLHGHTFALAGAGASKGTALGARKDTAAALPKRTLTVDFDADNPGLWMLHCHNTYHATSGMMTVLGYLK